jgi:exopolysaccharide biosynthesis polyprenyl glycosylphosphotransferase
MVMLRSVEFEATLGAGARTHSQPLPRHSSQPIARQHSQPIPRQHSQSIPRQHSQRIARQHSQPIARQHSQPLPRLHSQPLARLNGQSFLRAQRPTHPTRRPYEAVVAHIELRPLPRSLRIAKRALDVFGSGLGLLALAPVLLLLALAIKLTSRGPVLFVQERCGLGGRKFRVFKFRTMVRDAEARKRALAHLNEMSGPVFKIRRDPRITVLGGVLRRLSLDELPQLWNVVLGDMSLVGPRPPTPDEVERYTARHVQRLSVMPGITGLWQVSGRSDIADFERWVDLDLHYVRTCSMWTDLRILLKTVVVVARVRGAH